MTDIAPAAKFPAIWFRVNLMIMHLSSIRPVLVVKANEKSIWCINIGERDFIKDEFADLISLGEKAMVNESQRTLIETNACVYVPSYAEAIQRAVDHMEAWQKNTEKVLNESKKQSSATMALRNYPVKECLPPYIKSAIDAGSLEMPKT